MQSKADEKAAAANLRNAERLRAEGMDLAKQLNWEPDYVSDIMPAYQKAQSPVSRAFLESILTGANPSMVSSTRHGADRLRRGAQAGFDQQFGGWEELLARQRAAEQAMPWAPGKFSAPAVMPLGGAYAGPKVSGISSAGAPGWGGVGAETSDEELQALREERLRRMTGV
ncbi:MAG TPA: hypothetical protein VED01_03235 [Burkholderiales bacterium]|nr:hypothetical protein [Burkholderiales bacterium]